MTQLTAQRSDTISPDQIRARFSQAMSDMYQQEVPLYGDLIQLVADVNADYLTKNPQEELILANSQELSRLNLERHGAIRVGKPEELFNIRRVFAVMGMYPVAYYDLASAGVPVHSTAFRAVTAEAMTESPFRVFCSLLRLELIDDEDLRERAQAILDKRNIFTEEALRLVDVAEQNGGLTEEEANVFVNEALETFRWHSDATVTADEYDALSSQHRLIADVVAFKGPHINHLTPRTLDIDEVQRLMPERGIDAKLSVEGPPRRHCPILLRQTSFKALNEDIRFTDQAEGEMGKHSARFGEIEQRGVALTAKGRALYDQLLEEVRVKIGGAPTAANLDTYYTELAQIFSVLPDTHQQLHDQGLAFYHYRATAKGIEAAGQLDASLNKAQLLEQGYLSIEPMTYEDFLPVSAAGIFQSNLGDAARGSAYGSMSNQDLFERDLGQKVLSEMDLYAQDSAQSLQDALKVLGL
ncbi:2-oxoadipate dioxygenase/decarboxylase HglS [Vitreoscilla stercoraria]|uniref:2-oxoadipate dioxygenase/decarboxylase n=1 Tax=Vitreoscilla stercoraria TaxID=61 RepID=A0ABY4EB27_VITST|nr:VOC family protein [Vitreoscilla stercoraria]UOO92657.1 VOC family protein [Vitreoscilla stercoraria]